MFAPSGTNSYSEAAQTVEANYLIQAGDRIEIDVYTQGGERIIDPEFELMESAQNIENARPRLTYLVREDGLIKLPMIGDMDLEGLTINEAEELLEKEYAEFYEKPFVYLRYTNKRVIVLGASEGQVIPLENENTKVSEILALSQAINNEAKAHNIRLIRNDKMYPVDFSTFEGYTKSDYVVQAGDILYVEPVRRPVNEFFRDNGPIISIVTSVLSLVVVIISLNN